MSTIRQIEANRRNSQKSTGPTSVTGKATSSMNAIKTRIHAKSLALPSEKLADLEELIDEYYQSHRPASLEARLFVDELIHGEWMLRRLRTAETQLWQYQNENRFRDKEQYPLGHSATCNPRSFTQLQWRLDSTRHARVRCTLSNSLTPNYFHAQMGSSGKSSSPPHSQPAPKHPVIPAMP